MNVKQVIDRELDVLMYAISNKYNIKFQELKDLGGALMKNDRCLHLFISGNNAGSQCTAKPTFNGYCSKHQGTYLKLNSGVAKLKTNKTLTKTQQDIINWLNTAVPKDVTKLKKRSKGLFNEETEFIFDEIENDNGEINYIVQGKYINKKITPLSISDVEKCEKMGWKYNKDNIEPDE